MNVELDLIDYVHEKYGYGETPESKKRLIAVLQSIVNTCFDIMVGLTIEEEDDE